MVTISIVIPTMDRPKCVESLLKSILRQTVYPNEVIVVDDSIGEDTKELVANLKKSFSAKQIDLRHFRGKDSNRSISAARNKGIEQCRGNIVFFFDDDVTPYDNHIEEILRCYDRNPSAMAVQGYISYFGQKDFYSNPRAVFPNFRSCFLNAVRRVFFLPCNEYAKQSILPSGHLTFPYALTKDTNCSWICGHISSFRSEALIFKFNELLREYSRWEDVELSLKISQNYPNSLFITPKARGIHERSPLSRRPDKLVNYICEGYHTYFLFNEYNGRMLNKIAFFWSWLGSFLLGLSSFNIAETKSLIKVYSYIMEHFCEIKTGYFPFIDKVP